MNRKLIFGVIAGAAVLVAAGVAFAAASSSRRPERAKQFITWRLDDALDDIDATDAQRAKAHALKDQLFEEGMKLRDSKEEIQARLVEQWQSDRPDPAAVHRLLDQMVDEIRGFVHQAADSAIELHQVLTPEQRVEVLQRAEQHRSWRRR